MASDNIPAPQIQQLLEELKPVDNWFLFGVMLNVPVCELNKIKSSVAQGEIELYKTHTFQYWLDRSPTASWKDVVRALEQIDHLRLASQVKEKYLLSQTTDSTPTPVTDEQVTSVPDVANQPAAQGIDDPEAVIHADVNVVRQLLELESSFSHMLTKLRHHFAKRYLKDARFFLNDFLRTDGFSNCRSFEEILIQLRQQLHIDTFNIYCLQKLVAIFKKNKLTKLVNEYEQQKEEFLKDTTVVSFQRAVVSRIPPELPNGKIRLTIKIPRDRSTCQTLEDIKQLAQKGFQENERSFVCLHAETGSIVVSWFFPAALNDKLEHLAIENSAVFTAAGVEEVTIGGKRVFPCTKEEVIVQDSQGTTEVHVQVQKSGKPAEYENIEYQELKGEFSQLKRKHANLLEDLKSANELLIMREKVISALQLEADGRRTSGLELATKSRSEKSLREIGTQIAPNCRVFAVQTTEQELVPLPVDWEAHSGVDGRVFFVNHTSRSSQWQDPRTIKHYIEHQSSLPPQPPPSYHSISPPSATVITMSDSPDDEWQEVTGRKQRERGRSKPQAAMELKKEKHISYWKEILLITSAPPDHSMEIREVPRELDWKFADNYPPPSEVRRHYVFLNKDSDYIPGTSPLKDFCKEKHFENIKQFTASLKGILTKSVRPSVCNFQCTAHLGKIAWYVDEKLLCQQPLTLEKFNTLFLLRKQELMVKGDMCARAATNETKMLSKLCTNFVPEKDIQKSIYLQFIDKESDGTVIHRAEALECSDGSFKLKEFWCAKPLHTYKADFICLGRAHDFRIVCRCTKNKMADDVRGHIETVINSCVRRKDGFLQMILQTDRVVVRHVYEREVHRFQLHDGWVINFINSVDHIIEDRPVIEHKTTIPSGHECQEIEVMLEKKFLGQRDVDEMKEQALKMVDFAMNLVDMAEECLDPEKNM